MLTNVLSPSIRPLFVAVFVALQASSVCAQSILDRVVGESRHQPLILNGGNELSSQIVGLLAEAAGVPMGLEAIPSSRDVHPRVPFVASKKRLGEVLDAIIAADPRYEWREDDGAIVFRSKEAWGASSDILDIQMGPLTLDRVDSADAIDILKQAFGVQAGSGSGPGDTKRFSVNLPERSSLLHVLNAIVRAHGTIAWQVTGGTADYPVSLGLITGATGYGFGIPRTATIELGPLSAGHRHAETAQVPVLDRIVGPLGGQPWRMRGINGDSVSRLAAAVGVPMGVQTPARGQTTVPNDFNGIMVTGMPLRVALEALGRLDPRFEWQDMDGVIVFRPVEAWVDAFDPLFRVVPSVRLDDVKVSDAIGLVLSTLGDAAKNSNDFDDSRRLSIDLPPGTMVDLLNAVVRSHGGLTWGWDGRPPQFFAPKGYQHTLTFSRFQGTRGIFAVP